MTETSRTCVTAASVARLLQGDRKIEFSTRLLGRRGAFARTLDATVGEALIEAGYTRKLRLSWV